MLSLGDVQWCWHCCQIIQRGTKLAATKLTHHKTITLSLPNKQMPWYQAKFTLFNADQETMQGLFCFFFTAKQGHLEMQTKETKVHSVLKETQRCAIIHEDGCSQSLDSQHLAHRKDIKAFFPELTEEYREVGWPSGFDQKQRRKR